MSKLNEQLLQAEYAAKSAQDHIRAAYSAACDESPVAAMILLDLMQSNNRTRDTIKQLQAALSESK